MKKSIILSLFLLMAIFSYSMVTWEGDKNNVSIIYKIVDPVIVEVEKPQKIVVSSGQKNFTYSEMVKDRKRIGVKVNTPYNPTMIDDVLRAIYERVYFSLQDNGNFDLKNTTDPTNVSIIKGKGYFVDQNSGVLAAEKRTFYDKEFANSVGGVGFYTTTEIDADFTMQQDNMPMGVYTGTLKLDVWFGGKLK